MEFYDKIFTIMYGLKLLIKKHAVTQVNYTITQEIYLLRINQLKMYRMKYAYNLKKI